LTVNHGLNDGSPEVSRTTLVIDACAYTTVGARAIEPSGDVRATLRSPQELVKMPYRAMVSVTEGKVVAP
jgi:hypothetical protein